MGLDERIIDVELEVCFCDGDVSGLTNDRGYGRIQKYLRNLVGFNKHVGAGAICN